MSVARSIAQSIAKQVAELVSLADGPSELPALPVGQAFVIDGSGNYVIDDSGDYVTGDE